MEDIKKKDIKEESYYQDGEYMLEPVLLMPEGPQEASSWCG